MLILEIDCHYTYSFTRELAHLHKAEIELLSNMRIENRFESV